MTFDDFDLKLSRRGWSDECDNNSGAAVRQSGRRHRRRSSSASLVVAMGARGIGASENKWHTFMFDFAPRLEPN